MKLDSYKYTGRKGIDDLKSEYAFIGNSQGDTTATNNINEFQNSEGWLSCIFDVDMNQTTIEVESKRRRDENARYIQKLKDNGEYGEEYTMHIDFVHHPLFDEPLTSNVPLESYKMVMMDFNGTHVPDLRFTKGQQKWGEKE